MAHHYHVKIYSELFSQKFDVSFFAIPINVFWFSFIRQCIVRGGAIVNNTRKIVIFITMVSSHKE